MSETRERKEMLMNPSIETPGLDSVLPARDSAAAKDLRLNLQRLLEEASDSAAIMGMLNVYYRFRHMVAKNDDYRTVGLRMTALAKPLLGKERFEMLAFAVSVLNGCESCIRSHEEVLRQASVSID